MNEQFEQNHFSRTTKSSYLIGYKKRLKNWMLFDG